MATGEYNLRCRRVFRVLDINNVMFPGARILPRYISRINEFILIPRISDAITRCRAYYNNDRDYNKPFYLLLIYILL